VKNGVDDKLKLIKALSKQEALLQDAKFLLGCLMDITKAYPYVVKECVDMDKLRKFLKRREL